MADRERLQLTDFHHTGIAHFRGCAKRGILHLNYVPAFMGAKPNHQAFGRGVKLIGATAHYVTATLDEGPIIEQDVVRGQFAGI